MLQVKDLYVSYGQSEALHGISFEANKNETVAIMGRNGMGKTTLFKSLMGVLPTKAGEINVAGHSVSKDESYKRVAKGIAYVYSGGKPIRCMTDAWKFLGAGYIGPVPTQVVTMFVVFIIAVLFLNRTRMGRHIYAVGGNDTAAKFSGISTAKVKFTVYSFSGLMAGLAGITIASRLYSGTCTSGESAEMDAIAAVVVGGTSMSGGSGRLGGTLIGALIIGILDNGLNLMGVNSDWQFIIKGVVILGAVYMDFLRSRKRAKG